MGFKQGVYDRLGIDTRDVKRLKFSNRKKSGRVKLRSGEVINFFLNASGEAERGKRVKKGNFDRASLYVRREILQQYFV